ncbi:MAG TPA: nuclear transport factor 2 family protein [Thermoanaerobaculia bacterium]|nr:nuclear transport factor 2 family protein [Thermoanaerobaculia bacterium]
MASLRIETLRAGYRAFNRRDVEKALQMLDPQVEWPNRIARRVLCGQQALRQYWTRQFRLFDCRVEPEELVEEGDRILAIVRQRVRRLSSGAQQDLQIGHLYTFRGVRAMKMQVFTDLEAAKRALGGSVDG